MFDSPHRRYNPLTGEWVLVSPHRAKRPWQGQVEKKAAENLPHYDPTCYLCPGNERAGGIHNPAYTETFVFDNDFAALLPDSPTENTGLLPVGISLASAEPESLLTAVVERGLCRVVCFSPRHDLTLPELELPEIENVIATWTRESADLASKDFIRYVQVFENKGAAMGCSNPHPHSQLWSQSELPNEITKELAAQRSYFSTNGRPLLVDYLTEEHKRKERILASNEHFTALVPFWAVWPFEVLVAAHRPSAYLQDLNSNEVEALADVFKQVTTRYDNLFEISFPYSMGFHQAPADGQSHPEWVLHAHFYPPLLRSATVRKFMVGYEMLAMPQRDITPETAVERLLAVDRVPLQTSLKQAKHSLSLKEVAMHPRDIVKQVFKEKFGTPPTFIARAPGRVNLLGEHVDYNDGFVLPAAIDRATYVAFSASDDDKTTLVAADFDEKVVFFPKNISTKTQSDGSAMPEWVSYPAGMMWAISEAGLPTPAIRAVFSSDVPRGSGLSSSASVEMAFGVAWQKLGGWQLLPMELALLGQKAEVHYVGVNCGVMDQFASACGQADRLLYLDCRSLQWQTVPLSPDVLIVVADTTIRRKLTSGEYNKRHDACETAVSLLKRDLPGIKALRDVSIDDFNRLADKLPTEVQKRARHVVEEIERSRQAVPLLEVGNFSRFGQLMNECHASLRDLYEVSCPQLDVMARVAQSLPGCYGARLTGAGFGGCTVNLVAREQVEAFAKVLSNGYEDECGLHPEIYICRASAGASIE